MFMHFHIITLFPDVFKEYLNTSIIGRAVKQKSTREAWEHVCNAIRTIYGDAKVEAGSLHHLHLKRTRRWDIGIWRENRETEKLRGCPSSYPSKCST